MRAVVTSGPGRVRLTERPPPAEPGPGQVLVRPLAVGICGSDFHLVEGSTSRPHDRVYPLVQGHELAAMVERIGPDGAAGLVPGTRVAVWPVLACGRCRACRLGRSSVCVELGLIGVHTDGGLQDGLLLRTEQVVPVGNLDAGCAAFVEPTSVAVHAVTLARVERGEYAVVLGAGAIGLAAALALADAGAVPIVVDPVAARCRRAEELGIAAATLVPDERLAAAVRDHAGGDDAPLVLDTTGNPAVLGAALELAAVTGRVVLVGLSARPATVSPDLVVKKELQVLGASCSDLADFRAAAALVTAHSDTVRQLITDRYPLADAGAAMARAMNRDGDVLKVQVTLED